MTETGSKASCLAGRFPQKKQQLLFWGASLAVIALDLWSKHAVFAWMERRAGEDYKLIDGFLSIVMRENPGAAFGIAQGQRAILSAFALAAIIGIVAYFFLSGIRDRLAVLAMGLFLGGVVGNFYDRIFNNGLVRDFIDVYWKQWHWPAFNVADSVLCIAVGILVIRAFLTARPS